MNVSEDLELRLSHRYVGAYKHLDEHETIGSLVRVETHVSEPDPEDACESVTTTHRVAVEAPGRSEAEIAQALRDHYTSWGCAHDWDCCGCRSYAARKAERVRGDLWCVEVASSRNY